MDDTQGVEAPASANEELRLPEGDYAIVEVLGHRTMVGRISEVERFGTKLCAVEPLFQRALLPAVLVGGGSIYQLTPCSAEVAFAKAPKERWQMPSSIAVTLPPAALPAPGAEPSFAPAFLDEDDDDQVAF